MDYGKIRPDIIAALKRYGDRGIPTGDFLREVLSNNLMDAIARADDDNIKVIPEICCYVYNEIPSICHGSPERVKAWIKRHETLREGEKQERASITINEH